MSLNRLVTYVFMFENVDKACFVIVVTVKRSSIYQGPFRLIMSPVWLPTYRLGPLPNEWPYYWWLDWDNVYMR